MDIEPRSQLCVQLGLGNLAKAHDLIRAAVEQGVELLLDRGVDARHLERLGYSQDGMRKLGYDDMKLERLGYAVKPGLRRRPVRREPRLTPPPTTPHVPVPTPAPEAQFGEQEVVRAVGAMLDSLAMGASLDALQRLINRGAKAEKLKQHGYTLPQLRRMGLSASDLSAVGFTLDDLRHSCSLEELRQAGYTVREMKRFFNCSELRGVGYSAEAFRQAGYGVTDLYLMGFTEREVKAVGYSPDDWARAGLPA